jgi:hypothetical protein
VNARSTSEALRKEYFLFVTRAGAYIGFDKEADNDKALQQFAETVEARIETENSSTLQVMTRETQPEEPTERKGPPGGQQKDPDH